MTRFHIPPPIIGKGRPRHTKGGRTYTPTRTRKAEALVATIARMAHDGEPLTGPVFVGLAIVHPRPKRIAKAHPLRGCEGSVWCDAGGPHYPDADNVLKLIKAACNGIVYGDDRQVCEVDVKRFWGAVGESCGVWVEVTEAGL